MTTPAQVAARWLGSTQIQASRIDPPPAMLNAITKWALAQMATETIRDIYRLREKYKQPGRWDRLVDSLGEDFANDKLVGMAQTERLAKKLGGRKPNGPKPKQYKADFPLDLTGWRYAPTIENSPHLDWVNRMLNPTTVIWTHPSNAPPRVRGPGGTPRGTWDSLGLLRLFLGTPGTNPDTFRRTMNEAASTIRHELQHLAQTALQNATQSPSAGMPAGGRKDHSTPSDTTPGSSTEHALRDTEFYTRLQDAIHEFNRLRTRFGPASNQKTTRTAIRVFTYQIPAQPVGSWELSPNPFFKALKQYDPRKYRKAVSEFVKAVLRPA